MAPLLTWLSDADLDKCIDELNSRILTARNEASKRVIKNVLDPFSLLCLNHLMKNNDTDNLMETVATSSISKSVSSAIGNFHQDVLGRVRGFVNHDAGYDVECAEKKLFAEIKNKHNTMNASARNDTEKNLLTIRKSKPGYTGYLVIIIPKKPKRYLKPLGRDVFEVDGATFYEMATGETNALKNLYNALENRLSPDKETATFIKQQYPKSLPT
jgi:hypothetical protein